jgi:hypothetical protein
MVKACRHDVVHDIVVVGDRIKNPANMPSLFLFCDLLKSKVCLCHAVSVPAWQGPQRADTTAPYMDSILAVKVLPLPEGFEGA